MFYEKLIPIQEILTLAWNLNSSKFQIIKKIRFNNQI